MQGLTLKLTISFQSCVLLVTIKGFGVNVRFKEGLKATIQGQNLRILFNFKV